MSEKTVKILFIDDEKHIRIANQQTLELAGLEVECFASADEALALLGPKWPGIVVSDIKMPGMDGITFLERAQEIDRDIPVILVSGHADITMAVGAIRDGAYDFIEKPFAAETLIETVRRAVEKRLLTLENRNLRLELEAQDLPGPRIIGRTPGIAKLKATIARISDAAADVLLLGETGTGKELISRSLHEHSKRAPKNFVAINCGAVPENLIESELFGHEAGAFTGAQERRIGKFEHANGGTLFLDEIESMPMSIQIRLLRVLQEREVERVGSNQLIPLDIRVIAATKVDLKEASEKGEFRQDLYYRLNVVTLEIPPLRDRIEDIPLLFQHFLLVANSHYKVEAPTPSGNQIATLLAHSWPGNVRELRNIAERYVLLGEDCDFDLEEIMHGSDDVDTSIATSLPMQVGRFERSLIEQALHTHKGHIKETMSTLGVPRKTLYDKMKKYGLDKSSYKSK